MSAGEQDGDIYIKMREHKVAMSAPHIVDVCRRGIAFLAKRWTARAAADAK